MPKFTTDKESVPYAVVSVGGFLGMDTHNVVVAAALLKLVDVKAHQFPELRQSTNPGIGPRFVAVDRKLG